MRQSRILNIFLLFLMPSEPHKNETIDIKERALMLKEDLDDYGNNVCSLDDYGACTVTCLFCSQNEITKSLITITKNTPACFENGIKLKLRNFTDLENMSRSNCYSPKIYELTELTIEDSKITDIEPGIFDCHPYQDLKKLYLKNMPVSHLKYGIFRGLTSLWYLCISKLPLKIIDPNILEPLNSLSTLEFIEIRTPFNIKNLTGTVEMGGIAIVDLRFNNFCRTLNNKTFTGLKGVVSLFLSESKIRSIGYGTFDPIAKTLRQIYIKDNFLKTLPPGIFAFMSQYTLVKIYIGNNPWKCDCHLEELKSIVTSYANNFDKPVICNSPEMYSGLDLLDISISACNEADENPSIINRCENNYNLPHIHLRNHSQQKQSKIIQSEGQSMQITGNYEDGIFVEMNFSSNEYASIWFNDDSCYFTYFEENDEECQNDYHKSELVSNITPESSYIFCLVKKSSIAISPFNCAPYHIFKPDITNPDYIPEDNYYISVIIFIVLVVVAIFFGIFFGICLTRRYPAFVRSTASKILIQKISHNEIWKKNDPPIRSRAKPNLYRRHSDTSVASSQSYITTVAPSPYDILSWKMDRQRTTTIESICVDKFDIDSSPPPLPPHPKRKYTGHSAYQNIGNHRCDYQKPKKKLPNSTTQSTYV